MTKYKLYYIIEFKRRYLRVSKDIHSDFCLKSCDLSKECLRGNCPGCMAKIGKVNILKNTKL